MSNNNDAAADALMKVLEEIFDKLQKKGLLPAKAENNKKDILQSLAKQLAGKVKPEDLKSDPVVRMRAMAAIVGKGFGNEKFASIFTNNLEKNPKGKLNELDKGLLLLASMLKLEKNEPDKDLKLDARSIAKKILQPFFKETRKKDGKQSKEEEINRIKFEDAELRKFEDVLQQMFGGVSPSQPGSIPDYAVLAAAVQVNLPWTKYFPSDPTSTAFLVEENSYNSNKLDPTGKENALKDEDLAQGGLDVAGIVKSTMDMVGDNNSPENAPQSSIPKSPFSTSLKPPGSLPR